VLDCAWHSGQSKLCYDLVYDLTSGEGGDCGWKGQVVRPVRSSFEEKEFAGKYSLRLSIRLGMIHCTKVQIRSESFEQSLLEIRSEFRVPIRHNCLRNSIQACNFF
jgi:hypothetical protein